MIRLPLESVTALTDEVGRYGASRVETGGFLLAPAGADSPISVLALAGVTGIIRRRGLFVVSGLALDRLFTWADQHGLRIRAQFHSHVGPAFLSPTDLEHGLNVRGFVSCVVPFCKDPSNDPSRWGWWRFDEEEWREIASPELVAESSVTVVTFDEDGVR